jgi:methionyl-tRNA formyltransferase
VTRLAFLGTPAAAVPSLRALLDAGHRVELVVSRPDRRRGRGTATSPSPVKEAALELGLRVTERLADVADAGVDLGVVVAYGRIIPVTVLQRVPMVNLHFSLLPRWRGAAPVERAILAGDRVTGVCVMQVEEGLDTGPVYARVAVPIEPGETAEALRGRLAELGADLLVRTLVGVRRGGAGALPAPEPQAGEATYADKVEPSELELHWAEPAARLERLVRIGRAHTTFRGRRLRVVRAAARADLAPGGAEPGTLQGAGVATGAGVLELVEVQPEGSRPMPAGDWLRGARPASGERLGAGVAAGDGGERG